MAACKKTAKLTVVDADKSLAVDAGEEVVMAADEGLAGPHQFVQTCLFL